MAEEAISFQWHPSYLPSVISIMMLTINFVAFWFLAESKAIHLKLADRWSDYEPSVVRVVYQKALGFLLLGVVPLIISLLWLPYTIYQYGLGSQNTGVSLLWIFGIATVVVPLNMKAAKRPENLDYYPIMRVKNWSPKLVLLNAAATIAYLFAYELLFRGILLTTCVDTLGVWPAIAVNIALYSTTHLPKGPAETIGAIPFGLLMCYITLTTGTIWVAVVVHVILSLSNDYLAIHYNPKMRYLSF